MDCRIILNGYDYRDNDESDSESDDYDGPDLFEPIDDDSPFPSPRLTSQRSASPIEPLSIALIASYIILLSDKPLKPLVKPLIEPLIEL